MARPWILDTDTKGTGAEMRPLRPKVEQPASRQPRMLVPAKRKTRPAPPVDPRLPARFKVVDVLSRQVLAEGASTQTTLELLREMRSVVDFDAYVWERKPGDWRRLTMGEKKALWRLRAHLAASASTNEAA